MVDLVLNYLGGKAREGLDPSLELFVLPLNSYGAPAFGPARADKRQAALLGLIRVELFYYDGVEHDHVLSTVFKDYDALVDPDHICGQPDAAVLVGNERIQKILRNAEVIRRGRLCLLREKRFVFANFANHIVSSCKLKSLLMRFHYPTSGDFCPLHSFAEVKKFRCGLPHVSAKQQRICRRISGQDAPCNNRTGRCAFDTIG